MCVGVFMSMSLFAVGVVLPKSSTSAIWGNGFCGNFVCVFEHKNETSADVRFESVAVYHKLMYCEFYCPQFAK